MLETVRSIVDRNAAAAAAAAHHDSVEHLHVLPLTRVGTVVPLRCHLVALLGNFPLVVAVAWRVVQTKLKRKRAKRQPRFGVATGGPLGYLWRGGSVKCTTSDTFDEYYYLGGALTSMTTPSS